MEAKKIFNWMMAVAILSVPTVLTSCSDDDDDNVKTYVVSFEGKTLNNDGFWNGDETGASTTYNDGYGGSTTTYACIYTEGMLKFNTNYSVSSYGYDFWSGTAISNRTAKTFSAADMTPDQYNNVTGKARSGKNFAIVQTYGETIDIAAEKGGIVRGLYFTNSAYTANSILNGDAYSGDKFGTGDWLKCTITGIGLDKTDGASVDIYLAKDGSYVSDWQYADLRALGKVAGLKFSFSGSRNNEYGLLTPAYICIDDITVEVEQ